VNFVSLILPEVCRCPIHSTHLSHCCHH